LLIEVLQRNFERRADGAFQAAAPPGPLAALAVRFVVIRCAEIGKDEILPDVFSPFLAARDAVVERREARIVVVVGVRVSPQ